MIHGIIVVNNNGKVRLTKFFNYIVRPARVAAERCRTAPPLPLRRAALLPRPSSASLRRAAPRRCA